VLSKTELGTIDTHASQLPVAVIVNYVDRGTTDFGHWIAIYVYVRKRNVRRPKVICEVIDSYGKPMEDYKIRLPFAIAKENQSPDSLLCGHFCLRNWALRSENKTFEFIINSYTDSLYRNDDIVISYFKNKVGKLKSISCGSGGQKCFSWKQNGML
jgi:hypothetical protein